MSWLKTTDDEVKCFHPEFQEVGIEALKQLGIDAEYEWVHHASRHGTRLIPDFVLVNKKTKRWLLAVEIKRSREAVFSSRFQLQAKGYAEANQGLYNTKTPKYFVITNFETTILFALNGARPPQECIVLDGVYESGRFSNTSKSVHVDKFISDLTLLIKRVISKKPPVFEYVWPRIIDIFLSAARDLTFVPFIQINEPTTKGWALVRDYFGVPLSKYSSHIYLFRCLIAEYLRGILLKYGHKSASKIPPIDAGRPVSVAQAIAVLRTIDFQPIFEIDSADKYRTIPDASIKRELSQFLYEITEPSQRVYDLALKRMDSAELVETLFNATCPLETQDEYGKIQTDPELAAILCSLSIPTNAVRICDPCCGDGSLLSAAFNHLSCWGVSHDDALEALTGIEADGIALRLAALKLALKQPGVIHPKMSLDFKWGDMFAMSGEVNKADVVIMNPPFKRYEKQDKRPIPSALRDYYNSAIVSLGKCEAETTHGQANLYNYYIEYVGKCVKDNAFLGIILDNRWYHSKYGIPLRKYLLSNFEILLIFEYPHSSFFSEWLIATSIVVLRKKNTINKNHKIKFVRSKVDPRQLDLEELADAVNSDGDWPIDCTVELREQSKLNASEGWKGLFRAPLQNEYIGKDWPTLKDLFEMGRRGSLQKEGGGLDILEFPFDKKNYGYMRSKGNGKPYNTKKGKKLTLGENATLKDLAKNIPWDFRGYALKNADDLSGYEVTHSHVIQNPTLEPPKSRNNIGLFLKGSRVPWSSDLDESLQEMYKDPDVERYIEGVSSISLLDESILPRSQLWVVLREPVAGELIVPRKTRRGHRVHINPYAFDKNGRQVRISSNFITFQNCLAVEQATKLDRETATKLIVAFLLSSFGQLQFEMSGYNREGVLSLEKHHLVKISVFDPRWIDTKTRAKIIEALENLPFPIDSTRLSSEQYERRQLDELFAKEITNRNLQLNPDELLEEVENELDNWLISREP